MRIFLIIRNIGKIEYDKCLSKFNYGSRKTYTIEEVLLEKRLIYDNSLLSRKQTIHNMTDLQVCYD